MGLPAEKLAYNGYIGFANEVGGHCPELQRRAMLSPVVRWVGQYLEGDDRHPIAAYHLDLYDSLLHETRICIEAPRSYAKTTIIRNFVLYLMCNYGRFLEEHKKLKAKGLPTKVPCRKVRILSCSGPKAHEILSEIREVIEGNKAIIEDYGDLKGRKWTDVKGILKTCDGFEVTAAGRGAQVRGFRPDLLICDDLDDDEEVLSDIRMEKAFNWFDSAVYNTIDEDDYRVFVIGTVLDEVSLLKYIGDKPSFKRLEYDCYSTHDAPESEGYELWPSKWPHEKLQRRKADITPRAFAAEFRGKPQPSENPIFERHWFQPYDPTSPGFLRILEQSMHTAIGVDPAISKKDGADYTALVSLSATFDDVPRIYLRNRRINDILESGVKRGHWSIHRTVRETFIQYQAFQAKKAIIESNAYQKALYDEVKAYVENERVELTVEAVNADVDKERRANVVAPMVARGQVFYDPDDPEHLALIDECVLFKPGLMNIKKDRMDAFVHALTYLKHWSRRKRRNVGAGRVLPHTPNPITGV